MTDSLYLHEKYERNEAMVTTATSKGQIVIPSTVRKKMGIKKGTQILISMDDSEHTIILRPITGDAVRKFRGIFKMKNKNESVLDALTKERQKDREKEEKRYAKHRGR